MAEVVPNGRALSRARELAALYLKAPEVTRRCTRIHFIQPLKERIVREVGYPSYAYRHRRPSIYGLFGSHAEQLKFCMTAAA